MRIKDISSENRPRERLEKYGPSVLSDAELLSIVLRTGNRGENAIDISNRLISKYGINKLSSCSLNELRKVKGIGRAKACQIIAIFELNRRIKQAIARKPMKTPQDVYDYLHPKMNNLKQENFIVLHLDSKNRITKEETISKGILNASIVHPREIFRSAIKESSNSIILAHNHPSGDPSPSREDMEITKKIFEAGKLLSINVLDHVIIGNASYYSFNLSKVIYNKSM